jgi:hypothetical protein
LSATNKKRREHLDVALLRSGAELGCDFLKLCWSQKQQTSLAKIKVVSDVYSVLAGVGFAKRGRKVDFTRIHRAISEVQRLAA